MIVCVIFRSSQSYGVLVHERPPRGRSSKVHRRQSDGEPLGSKSSTTRAPQLFVQVPSQQHKADDARREDCKTRTSP
jgi:hypothetical protein